MYMALSGLKNDFGGVGINYILIFLTSSQKNKHTQ